MKSTSRRRRVPRFLDSIALLSLALVLAWLAGTSLVHQVELVDLYRSARALERDHRRNIEAVERRSADIARLVAEHDCDDAGLRSGIMLSLGAIERRDPSRDFENWAAALDRSRQVLRLALECSPHRGIFWARLAMVERLIAASPARIMPLAAMSIRLSPSELGVIRTRFQLWRNASTWLPPGEAAPLQADIRTILSEAQLPNIKQMIGGSPFLLDYARREVLRMSEERQAELKRLRFDREAEQAPPRPPRFDLLDTPRR